MNKKILLSVLSVSFAAQVMANPNVIYGEDNRKEVFEASKKHKKLAHSAATMVHKAKMSYNENSSQKVSLEQTSLNDWFIAASEGYGLCEGTRFSDQPNPGDCSGFLIAPDLLVTAGHCAAIENSCEEYKWVFDFKVDKKTSEAGIEINSNDIYSCKSLLTGGLNSKLGYDFAVIRLDRRVTNRTPLKINTKGDTEVKTPLVVIGSPSGLPLKVADGAEVRSNAHPNFFVANLDTFQGNSGSAVFNDTTGTVEGILVRGENDYVPNVKKGCFEPNVCEADKCRGEDVSKMSSIPEVMINETLLTAVEQEQEDVIAQIADYKLSLDFNLIDGKTALHKAVEKNKVKSVKVLIEKGADVNYQDAKGNTPAMILAKKLSKSNEEILNLLVKGGADLEIKNDKGQTAMAMARAKLNRAGVKILKNLESNK